MANASRRRKETGQAAQGFRSVRIERVQRTLKRRRADALVVVHPPNVLYLSGFTGEDSWLVVTRDAVILVTDFRFRDQAATECAEVEVVVRRGPIVEETRGLARAERWGRVLVEGEHIAALTYGKLSRGRSRSRAGWSLAPGLVEKLRVVKDAGEISAIRRSTAIACDAFRSVAAKVRPGARERALADRMEWEMRRGGAEASAFPTIVAFDERAALPHAQPGAKRLGQAGTALFDWGARADGYNCDLTRIVARGRMWAPFGKVFRTVFEAQQLAIERVRPGVAAGEVDRAARRHIERAGYGAAFGHGTGHGVGLEIHEAPTIRKGSNVRLEPGMVFTVEPGVYLSGLGGVRIEDTVVVTDDGAQVLGDLRRSVWRV